MPVEQESQFIGRIIASATHEMNNILAVIKETSGLIRDFTEMGASGADPYLEKKINGLEAIRGQAMRGVALQGHLNSFAHTLDGEKLEIDVHKMISSLAVLVERLARQRHIDLYALPSESDVRKEVYPLALQSVLYACIDKLISRMPEKSRIEVSAVKRAGDVVIAVKCLGDGVAPEALRHVASELMNSPGVNSLLAKTGVAVAAADGDPLISLTL